MAAEQTRRTFGAAPHSLVAALGALALGAAVVLLASGHAVGGLLRDLETAGIAVRPGPAALVHAHGLRAGLVAAAVTRRMTPYVVTWHNAAISRGPLRAVAAGAERIVARRADVSPCVSPALEASSTPIAKSPSSTTEAATPSRAVIRHAINTAAKRTAETTIDRAMYGAEGPAPSS